MGLRGGASWQIRISQARQDLELPLWVRAVERIEAAGALVPGPLDLDPLPPPSPTDVEGHRARQRADEMAEGWAVWWDAEVRRPSARPPTLPRTGHSFQPPDFDGLRRWPYLREVVSRRWTEALRWQRDRKRAATDSALRSPDNGRVVREVERWLGRPVRPFVLELIVLPVLDDEVRRVWDEQYLVPERSYEGPGWPDILQRIVVRLGS
jgi:hypothetical protein